MNTMDQSLPYMANQPKIIFFTDFDGTITLEDSNDHLVDNLGMGAEKRRSLELDVLKGKLKFRDAFEAMLDSVKLPFDECVRILQKNIKLDPHFLEFYNWATKHNVPVVVLSSGMTPIINALLENVLGSKPDNIFTVANDVEPREGMDINVEGGWRIKYRDRSEFGHDKSLEIRPYAALPVDQRPILLFAGDGVSDLSAACGSHILFAKNEMDLAKYCGRKGIPFVPFNHWASILKAAREIYDAELDIDVGDRETNLIKN